MKNDKSKQSRDLTDRVRVFLLALCLVVAVSAVTLAADSGTDSTDNKLKNGSFEMHSVTSWTSGVYAQPHQKYVPSWNTTAFEEKIELFKVNTGTYIGGVMLKPSAGEVAAELNADEESTLYQNVKTSPASIYEWGLDHGGRTTMDTMALVIGPAQNKADGTSYLSKPSKAGRDQLMQMIDWLIAQGKTSVKNTQGLGEQLTVYSKKFAANGTFEDNAGNNAFSLTPSKIYTEEWHIWIMADGKATSGTNSWGKYGSNAGSGGKSVDLSKYYLYTVPEGQRETLFAFVSVGCKDNQGKTYGNFLDNINFQLYHPLSGSTSTHGSAVVGGSDGTAGGVGGSSGHTVTVDGKLTTYITDGEKLKIQAIVKKTGADANGNPTYDGCEFVGLYYTVLDSNGNPKTKFLQLAGNEIEDSSNLKDEEKKGKWVRSENSGDIVYTYYLDNVSSATDLHFVFIKSPTITYDPNGGKPYVVERTYNTNEAENVYSFKPAVLAKNTSEVDATTSATPSDKPKELFISPYKSEKPEGQNDGWKFMGWLLTGDTVDVTPPDGVEIIDKYTDNEGKEQPLLGNLILPAEHTVACDYSIDGASGEQAAQYFKIYNGKVTLEGIINKENSEIAGVTWTGSDEAKVYANVHKGLTLVAQWRWLQAFIPQVRSGSDYTDSANGGTVEITSVANKSDENYNAAYNANGGKSYHAETDETITATATATAKDGYTFEGWYDSAGKLVTTSTTLTYTESKGGVNTYYARFSGSVTQTYIRQVKNGDNWEVTTDDNIGTLGRYTYTDAPGTPISSTATAKSGYKFVGWYDSKGNKVEDSMLINGGTTISYTTGTSNATYYARFETAYTVKFAAQTKQPDGTFKTDNKGGKVSVASVSDVAGTDVSSTATVNSGYKFLGWYDKDGNQLSTDATYKATITTTNNVTYYARFEPLYTVNFVAQTRQEDGSFNTDNVGGTVSVKSVANVVVGTVAESTATANQHYFFLGWYDASGKKLGTDATYSLSITGNATYYARFALTPEAKVENGPYLSFVAESADVQIPSAFDGRNAGTGKNTSDYGLDNKFGNTIATGFKYSLNTMTGVNTIQITVTVPEGSYIKLGSNGQFKPGSYSGTKILDDSDSVVYNKGTIICLDKDIKLTYYWTASGLQANETYGFIVDNLYAPDAKATITINGKADIEVTNDNGVVNTASGDYKKNSHYNK